MRGIAQRGLPNPRYSGVRMQIAQPGVLILAEAVDRTIGLLITGLVIAALYGRPDRANAG